MMLRRNERIVLNHFKHVVSILLLMDDAPESGADVYDYMEAQSSDGTYHAKLINR
jgi:hypothetical protein